MPPTRRVARQDREQARTALYPSLSAKSEYLGTEGNGKIPTSRFVTNDGVHVYREWAVVHQDLSPGTFTRAGVAAGFGAPRPWHAPELEIARRGLVPTVTKAYYGLLAAQRKYATAQQAARSGATRARTSARTWNTAAKWRTATSLNRELQQNAQQQALNEAQLAMESRAWIWRCCCSATSTKTSRSWTTWISRPPCRRLPTSKPWPSARIPTLGVAMQALRGASLDVTLARQAYLPTISVDAVYGIEANAIALNSTDAAYQATSAPLPTPGYFIDAALNIPVWDWGVRRSKVRQAETQTRRGASRAERAQRTLIRNLARLLRRSANRAPADGSAARAVDLASESLRLNTLRYQAGEATILELVDAANHADSRPATRTMTVWCATAWRIANLQTLTGIF